MPPPPNQPGMPALNDSLPAQPPRYTPAPHLTNNSLLTTSQLIYFFQDFYSTLTRIPHAPDLVFERLVTNLYSAITAAIDQTASKGSGRGMPEYPNDQSDEGLQLARIRSAIPEVEQKCKRLATALYEPRRESAALRHSEDRLRAEVVELKAATSVAGLEQPFRQQAAAVENPKHEGTTIQLLSNRLNETLEKLNLAIHTLATTLEDYQKEALWSPNRQIKAELSVLRYKDLVANNPAIGISSWPNHKGQDVGDLVEISFTRAFTTKHPVSKVLPLGYKSLYTTTHGSTFMSILPENIQNGGFQVGFYAGGKTVLNSADCTWLEVGRDHEDFQVGEDKRGIPHKGLEVKITFPRPYAEPPQVVTWFRGFCVGTAGSFSAYPTDITTTGFRLCYGGSFDYSVVLWIACTTGKVGVYTGTTETSDLGPSACEGQGSRNGGYVVFGSGTFLIPPRVIIAMSRFEIGSGPGLRFELRASDITTTGMFWYLESLPDTTPSPVGASFIALG